MAEREILFRGKRTDNSEWVYGYVGTAFTIDENKKVKSRHFTALDCLGWSSQVLVSDETIGQYTGLTDKNGVKIFERDIIKTVDGRIGVVHYSSEKAAFVAKNIKTYKEIQHWTSQVKSSEVIGNIHDNPELLETAVNPVAKNIAQSGLAPATENFELMEG